MNDQLSQPPRFIRPGDDPRLDAVLKELKQGGAEDPLFIDYRKQRGAQPPAAVPAAQQGTAARQGRRRQGLWIVLGVLAIVAPLLALALAVMIESLRQTTAPEPTITGGAAGQEVPADLPIVPTTANLAAPAPENNAFPVGASSSPVPGDGAGAPASASAAAPAVSSVIARPAGPAPRTAEKPAPPPASTSPAAATSTGTFFLRRK